MMEDLILLLIKIFKSDVKFNKFGIDVEIRREIIHGLVGGSRTHSDLIKYIPVIYIKDRLINY